MKDLIDLIPFFHSYGLWVRWLVVAWILFTSSLASVLIFASRTGVTISELSIDAIRVVNDATNKSLTFELLIRNSLPHIVQLTELQVSLYGETKPAGGLQSSTEITAKYVIKQLDSGKISVSDPVHSDLQYDLSIIYPYSGQEYLEAKIPISQTLPGNLSDRFMVQFFDVNFISQYHKNIEVVILYNGNKLSNSKNTKI